MIASRLGKMPTTLLRRLISRFSLSCGLGLPQLRDAVAGLLSLGRSDVIVRLQHTCSSQEVRNHVVEISFQEGRICIAGMLYSAYGWVLELSNQVPIESPILRLENPITHMEAPEQLRDITLSPDAICIVNPDFIGQEPLIPQHWKNS